MPAPTEAKADTFVAHIADHEVEAVNAMSNINGEAGQADLTQAARQAEEREIKMGVMEAFRRYPKATMFSMIYSTALVMEGYDTSMIKGFYAQPQFQRKFGDLVSGTASSYVISAPWQTALSMAIHIGSLIGLLCGGYLTTRYGYRKTMGGSLVLMCAFIFITFFAPNIVVLFIGEMLCGAPWGVFQTLTTAFASEICPIPIRHFLTTYVNLCWVMGQFIAAGTLRGFLSVSGDWAWRAPFGIQWFWPIPIAIGVYFSPESPWWYVRAGRLEDARASLKALTGTTETDDDRERTLALMVDTNEREIKIAAGTSYIDCLRGVNLRRTELTCLAWLTQAWCGSALMGYATYFLTTAGLATTNAFSMTMANYGLGAIGTIGSWFVMQKLGRRQLYLLGLGCMEVLLFIVGGLGFASPLTNSSVAWAIGSLLLIFVFVYDFTVGPVCYTLVSEMSSTRLRAKTIVLARSVFHLGGIINEIIMPRMLTVTAWNWGARTGLFWAGVNGAVFAYHFFRLPETKGRSFAQLDSLFAAKTPARRFKHVTPDDASSTHDEVDEKGTY